MGQDPQASKENAISFYRIEFVRAVAEGDLVALHTHQTWPGNDQYVTIDFFRFDDNGKIVEHCDSIQQVPAESKNANPMY